jgi:EmrB/QacA subfamily drug resistance transporter
MTTTTDPTPVAAAPALTPRRLRIIFGGVLLGISLSALDGTIVNTALSTIVGDLGGLNAYTWVGTAYLLTSTAATPLFGKLSDLYGRRLLFEAAITIFVISSALCGVAQTMTQLILARGLQGIGGGGLLALTFAIIGDVVPPRERGRYVGLLTGVFTVASVIGPLLGGFFVDHLSWRWIFYVNLPLGMLALAVCHRALALPFTPRKAKVDVIGSVSLVGAITSLLLLVSWVGESYGWVSPLAALFGAITVGSGALFWWWEARAPEPIVPLHLLRNDVIRIAIPMAILASTVQFGGNVFLPLFLQGVTGVSPTNSGLLLVPLAIGVSTAATLTGRHIARTGRYKIWPIAGSLAMTVATAMFAVLRGSTAWLGLALPAMLVFGLAIGASTPPTTLAVQNAVEHRDLGAASSLIMFVRTLGGAIGLAVFGALFNRQLDGRVPRELVDAPRKIHDLPDAQRDQALDALTHAITSVFMWGVPVVAASAVFAFLLPERPLRTETGRGDPGAAAAAH